MLFYMLLMPLALALTIFIFNANIDVIYKEILVFVPIPSVLAGWVADELETRRKKKGEDDNVN